MTDEQNLPTKKDESKNKIKHPQYKSLNISVLYDERLSWKAKAILFYLLSKPNGWKGHIFEMNQWAKDGKKSTQSGLKELREFGYVTLKMEKDENGKHIGKYYEVKDEVDFMTMKIGDIQKYFK